MGSRNSKLQDKDLPKESSLTSDELEDPGVSLVRQGKTIKFTLLEGSSNSPNSSGRKNCHTYKFGKTDFFPEDLCGRSDGDNKDPTLKNKPRHGESDTPSAEGEDLLRATDAAEQTRRARKSRKVQPLSRTVHYPATRSKKAISNNQADSKRCQEANARTPWLLCDDYQQDKLGDCNQESGLTEDKNFEIREWINGVKKATREKPDKTAWRELRKQEKCDRRREVGLNDLEGFVGDKEVLPTKTRKETKNPECSRRRPEDKGRTLAVVKPDGKFESVKRKYEIKAETNGVNYEEAKASRYLDANCNKKTKERGHRNNLKPVRQPQKVKSVKKLMTCEEELESNCLDDAEPRRWTSERHHNVNVERKPAHRISYNKQRRYGNRHHISGPDMEWSEKKGHSNQLLPPRNRRSGEQRNLHGPVKLVSADRINNVSGLRRTSEQRRKVIRKVKDEGRDDSGYRADHSDVSEQNFFEDLESSIRTKSSSIREPDFYQQMAPKQDQSEEVPKLGRSTSSSKLDSGKHMNRTSCNKDFFGKTKTEEEGRSGPFSAESSRTAAKYENMWHKKGVSQFDFQHNPKRRDIATGKSSSLQEVQKLQSQRNSGILPSEKQIFPQTKVSKEEKPGDENWNFVLRELQSKSGDMKKYKNAKQNI